MATIGDVVYLKSGGPPMTCTYVRDDGVGPVVGTNWFNGGLLMSGSFDEATLMPTDPQPKIAFDRNALSAAIAAAADRP